MVWLLSVGSWSLLAGFGGLLGVVGSILAFVAAGTSALGLGSEARRRRAIVGLVTAGLALVLPFALALVEIWRSSRRSRPRS